MPDKNSATSGLEDIQRCRELLPNFHLISTYPPVVSKTVKEAVDRIKELQSQADVVRKGMQKYIRVPPRAFSPAPNGLVSPSWERTSRRPDSDQTADRLQSDNAALISAKEETIAALREQLEAERQAHSEARRLLMAPLARIPPQLEAPQEASEASETVEEPSRPTAGWAQEGAQRPWWRRVFDS